MADAKAKYILEAEDRTALALKKAKRGFSDLTGTVKRLGGPLAALGSIAGLKTLAADAVTTADRIGKTADKIGLSTDALQELRFAADRTGVAQNALDMGMQRFSRRVGEVAQGTGVLKEVFDQYGIQVTDSDGRMRRLEDILSDYADTIKGAESDQEKLRLAFKAFDSEGAALVNTLRDGSDGLEQLRANAREAGAVLEEDLVRKAEVINDRWDTLTTSISTRIKSITLSTLAFLSGSNFDTQTDTQIGRLNNQIKDLNKGIELFQAQIDQLKAMDNEALTPAIDTLKKRMQEANDQVSTLRGEIDRLSGKPLEIEIGGGADDAQTNKLKARFDTALESLRRSLAAIGQVTQYERTLWEVQKGRYQDLSDSQKQALLDTAKEIDQKRAQLEVAKSLAESEEEAARKLAEYEQAQEAAAQRWRELINPMEEVDQQLTQLDILLKEGRISWDTYGEALFMVLDDMDQVDQKIEETGEGLSEFAIQARRNIESAFGNELFDIIQGRFDNIGDAFKGMLDRMVSELLASQLLDMLSSLGTSGSGNILTDALGALLPNLSGARALGSSVAGGANYLIGERGPEIFTPWTSGTITPNSAIGTGLNMTVNYNVTGQIDRRTADQLAAKTGQETARAMRRNR